jgi:hypothetical protein
VPEIIDPVFAKTSQNARFLLSENERFGLVFVKTGSINSGTGICYKERHGDFLENLPIPHPVRGLLDPAVMVFDECYSVIWHDEEKGNSGSSGT